MGIKLNLTTDEIKGAQGEFTVLPEGIYGAFVYEAKFKKSRAGNDMYELNFKITEGPAGIGRKIMGWFTLTPKALFKVVELNKAVGFPYPNKSTPAGEFEFNDADDYLQEKVNLQIIQEPYEGVDDDDEPVTLYRNNIKKVLAYDPDKVTSEDDVEEKDDSGLFL